MGSSILDRCSDLDWNPLHHCHCFQKPLSSNVHTRNGVFSNVSTFERLFSSVFLAVLVWLVGENLSKSMHFQTEMH